MQMRNVHMMHMSPFRDATFMMQMSHARVQMQSLSMMVLAHIFNRDANVFLQRWRCKNLVVQMSSNGHVMMQMSFCGYAMMSMPFCGYAVMQMSHWCMSWCECFDANTIYSKISFIFKTRLPQHLKFKYFQNSIYSSQKIVIFFFYLRLPKKIGDHC